MKNSDSSLIRVNIDWEKIAKEAIELCPKIKKDREIEILYARFGINSKPITLQAIGNKHQITRERVRQIVNNSLSKIRENCLSEGVKKSIKTIESFVEQNGGFSSTEVLSDNFTDNGPKQINGLRFILSLSKKITYVQANSELKEGWRLKNVKINLLKEVLDESIDLLKNKRTLLDAKEISGFIKKDSYLVNSVLAASSKLIRTEVGKWGLATWTHINPRSIKDKSKYVMRKHGKPIHYHDLSNKISKMGEKKVTKQSVHNELIKNNDFILVGRGIYALSEWGYQPGVVEEVIITVLEEAGEPLHKSVIIEKVLEKRIVKPSTIILNLQKPKFKKIGKSVYTLN